MTPRVYRLVLLPTAEADIAEAFQWYESQKKGLGREFMAAFRASTGILRRAPFQYQTVEEEARRVLLHRFPYAVIYEVHGSDVVILA